MPVNKRFTRHQNRNDLVGEYIWGDIGQIILFLIFIVIWITDSFIIKYSIFLQKVISFYYNVPVSIICFAISIYLAVHGLRIVFGEVRDKPEVIKKNVFGWVRHPIYLSSLLLYIGLFILTLSLYSFIFWFIILFFYNYIATYEEKKLLRVLGNDYKKYMDSTPKWIPFLKIFKNNIFKNMNKKIKD